MSNLSKLKTHHKLNIAVVVALIGLVGMICIALITLLIVTSLFLRPPEPALTPTPTVTAIMDDSCNNAIFVTDVTVPDGTVVNPNQPFVKTWRIKNIGTCNWDNTYSLVFIGGNKNLNTQNLSISNVSSDSDVDISVALVAPSTAGKYEGHWRLRNGQGVYFGNVFSVYIEVKP